MYSGIPHHQTEISRNEDLTRQSLKNMGYVLAQPWYPQINVEAMVALLTST